MVPWVYYAQTPGQVADDTVDLTVRFTQPPPGDTTGQQYLIYYMAAYTIDGVYQGMQELKT